MRRSDPVACRTAIELWSQALAIDPDRVDVLVRLARARHWWAYVHAAGDDDKRTAWQEGVDRGKRAIELDPANLEAKYWTAVNLAHLAGVSPRYQQALLLREMLPLYEEILAVDDTIFYGGAHVFFGLYHTHAPSFMGGDRGKARKAFERALEIAPDYLPNTLAYAEDLLLSAEGKSRRTAARDREKARGLIERALALPVDVLPDVLPENGVARARLQRLRDTHFGAGK